MTGITNWISVEHEIPEIEDNSVLAYFENGSIETVHIEDFFDDITNGLDVDGQQMYTKRYIGHNPALTHWMPLPEPPK